MAKGRYAVKEIYYSLQGEGERTGRPAVFCRFAGCNLWSGHEVDREDAICNFCDTEFVGTNGPGGGEFESAENLATAIEDAFPEREWLPYVVFTGGEPLLQLDTPLIRACRERDIEVAIETNGTIPAPEGINWICVSPKPDSNWIQRTGQELKIIFPTSLSLDGLCELPFDHFFLQPMDGPDLKRNTELTIAYCRSHAPWQISLQTHKLMGMP